MGAHGIVWVVGQFVIAFGIIATSFVTHIELPYPVRLLGVLFQFIGAPIAVLGVLFLAGNFTVFPIPKNAHHQLVTTGVYRLVRHPIYSGFFLFMLGWSLWWGSLASIVFSCVLLLWFDFQIAPRRSVAGD